MGDVAPATIATTKHAAQAITRTRSRRDGAPRRVNLLGYKLKSRRKRSRRTPLLTARVRTPMGQHREDAALATIATTKHAAQDIIRTRLRCDGAPRRVREERELWGPTNY